MPQMMETFTLTKRRQALTVAVSSIPMMTLGHWSSVGLGAELSDSDVWIALGKTRWVRDGSESAPGMVYVITDPNCNWCHRFWDAVRPWVCADQVQIRHVLVGIVKSDSARKAATILSSKDSSAALKQNESAYESGGISPTSVVSADIQTVLTSHLRLMDSLGFRGTPALVFKGESGKLERLAGFPRDGILDDVMGSVIGSSHAHRAD